MYPFSCVLWAIFWSFSLLLQLQERHKSGIGKLRDGYQKEIEAAIRRAETAEQHSKEKDAVIDKQRKRIDQLDRKANP